MADVNTPATNDRASQWARTLIVAIASAAAAWGAVKVEIASVVKAETTYASIGLKGEATAVITHRIDSAVSQLSEQNQVMVTQAIDTISERILAMLEQIPQPRIIDRPVLVPTPPDSLALAQEADKVYTLSEALRELGRIQARDHSMQQRWIDVMTKRGIEKPPPTKHSNDGH